MRGAMSECTGEWRPSGVGAANECTGERRPSHVGRGDERGGGLRGRGEKGGYEISES